MVYTADGQSYIIRLMHGERLSDAIAQFVSDTAVRSAWLTGLGAASDITLGFYRINTHEYQLKTIADMHEIAALQGNIALDEEGEAVFHLHGTFANLQYQTIGGHVRDFTAGATVELYIQALGVQLHRRHDERVGLPVLAINTIT